MGWTVEWWLTCDECEQEVYDVVGGTLGEAKRLARGVGWKRKTDGRWLCPTCLGGS